MTGNIDNSTNTCFVYDESIGITSCAQREERCDMLVWVRPSATNSGGGVSACCTVNLLSFLESLLHAYRLAVPREPLIVASSCSKSQSNNTDSHEYLCFCHCSAFYVRVSWASRLTSPTSWHSNDGIVHFKLD